MGDNNNTENQSIEQVPGTEAVSNDPWAAMSGNVSDAGSTEAAQNAANTPAGSGEAGGDAAAADPWGSMSSDAPVADPSGSDAWLNTGSSNTGSADWLSSADPASAADAASSGFHLSQLWDGSLYSPVETGINQAVRWLSDEWRPFFQAVRIPIDHTLTFVSNVFQGTPVLLMIAILVLLAWQMAGGGLAIGALVSLLVLVVLGVWQQSMLTLALVLTSLVFCVIIGLPLGIMIASSNRLQRIVRPILDAMQTTPSFVYLVPIASLVGIGNVPGAIVTIIFALPPLVRMTDLGIRHVRSDLVEASRAYGASRWQLLRKVQIPLALPSIMAGINQSLMLAMSMVVVASMISVAGLGQMVYEGMSSMNMGKASIGGLGIVILAIVLDRVTQAMGQRQRQVRHWWQTGPVGLVMRLFTSQTTTSK
ncbi:ABC transporter permease [Saezia sanguinis]|uniref:ABC transporter permease n=1 Tax=Saezia sanguinis TaxID=1965230 RepID=UPI0030757B38